MSSSPTASERDHLLPENHHKVFIGSNNANGGGGSGWNNNSSDGEDESSTIVDLEGGRFLVSAEGLNNRKNGDSTSAIIHQVQLPALRRPFPAEKRKTFLAFLFLAFNMILNLVCLSFIHDRVPDRTITPPLPDIFFDFFQPRDWALDASEIVIISSVWGVVLILLAHKHRFIILRRVFTIMGIVYFMRSITMFVTQLPVASTTYYCSPKANHTTAAIIAKRVLQLMGGLGLSINGLHTYCGDYIFSGHTVILVLAYLVIREYASPRCRLLRWISMLASSFGVFMVLLARGHYTVDVVIAYYITTRVFWIYHTLAANKATKGILAQYHSHNNNFPGAIDEKSALITKHKLLENKNYLTRVWWYHIFKYFEENVEGVVPCQFEFPVPSSLKKISCCKRTRTL